MVSKNTLSRWINMHKEMTKRGVLRSFFANLQYSLAKDRYTATKDDNFKALAIAVRDRLVDRWISTQQKYHHKNVKRVYYLSMEFLIGRLLGNNIMNLDFESQIQEAMEELGFDLEGIRDCEIDAALGNGGLGRLAACFLDSMATLGIAAHGYGIRYDYGIFKQKIINGYQVESPDLWLNKGNPWEFQRAEYSTNIKFYGHTFSFTDVDGKPRVKWVDTQDVVAMPYDIPVSGYKNGVVNTLRLWSARSNEEFDLSFFNEGDYEGAVNSKVSSENISKVLYPNDNIREGKELRLKQEYFFTAASISDIIRRFKAENSDFKFLPDKAVIQLNDTHPSLAIVELLRILLDEEHLEWADAWGIVVKTFAYTNHTVMPEALERWSVSLFETLLPRHLQIVYEINLRFLEYIKQKFPDDGDRLRRMSIIEEGYPKKIRMAFLSIVGSHSVNGVSMLHTELIKTQLFKDFYELYPERFNNKTNGITQRRWLLKSNTCLSSLISEAIGNTWAVNADELKKLLPLSKDEGFCEKWRICKYNNKKALAAYIQNTTGVGINDESMFDVHIKRMHEYKRQLLFAFFIIAQYLKIKNNPNTLFLPRTCIIAGKAAPGYFMAKLIIKFINNIANVINNDTDVGDKLKVVFLEDYRVSLAEKIFPASDLSEQISTAGTEASGTGCMKFMLNGALTIGTYDGANIEMAEAVGGDNIFLFGLKVHEIEKLRREGYNPHRYIENSSMLKETIKLIQNNFFSETERDIFNPIVDSLIRTDPYFICADFEDYCSTQGRASDLFVNKKKWFEKSVINVATSGTFSSDRTVKQYADDIWKIAYDNLKWISG